MPVGKEAADEALENVWMLCWSMVWSRPLCQTLSKAFSKSMNTDTQACILFFASVIIWVSWNSLSFDFFFALNPACSSFIILFVSTYCVNLVLIIFSIIFDRQLVCSCLDPFCFCLVCLVVLFWCFIGVCFLYCVCDVGSCYAIGV